MVDEAPTEETVHEVRGGHETSYVHNNRDGEHQLAADPQGSQLGLGACCEHTGHEHVHENEEERHREWLLGEASQELALRRRRHC